MKVDHIYLASMTNDSLNAYMMRIVACLIADDSPEAEMGAELKADQEAFQASIRQAKKSAPGSLKEIDKIVDVCWRGTRSQVKLSCKNPDPEISEAAQKLLPCVSDLPEITNKKYDQQYGALSAMLNSLESFDEATLTKALVISWVKALRKNLDIFNAMRQGKIQAKANQNLGVTQRLRDQLIAAYYKIIDRLNAICILMPDDRHIKVNAQINQIIAERRLSDKLSKRKPSDGDDEDKE